MYSHNMTTEIRCNLQFTNTVVITDGNAERSM